MKYTPGPWFAVQLGGGQIAIDAKPAAHDHKTICVLARQESANAWLIASAPDLLSRAKEFLGDFEQAYLAKHGDAIHGAISTSFDLLRAAVAKAEGRGE